jgi:hypothetical protein
LVSDDVTRSSVSAPNGTYAFEDLTPDATFMLRAELPGFLTATRPGLLVSADATLVVDISMKLGCIEDPHVVQETPLEQLMSADGVIHLRIASDSQDIRIETEHECLHYHASDGEIRSVGSSRRGEFRARAIIQLSSDGPLRAGTEYLALVRYNERFGRFWFYNAIPVTDGRLDGNEWFGIGADQAVGSALAHFRDIYARHTRYKPHGAPGAEAPLHALRYNTGWFDLGALYRDRDSWFDPAPTGYEPIERPFEFIGDPLSSRQLPRRGDRIRLYKGGPISIMDFGSRGEARRNRRPNTWKSESWTANLTGTRVDAGGVYTVADVFMWTSEHERFMSVRLVAD